MAINTRQRFERMPDHGTQRQRYWLEQYARWIGFGPPSRYKITEASEREGGDRFWVNVLCYHGYNGHFIGIMALNIQLIKKWVAREKARHRRELARQAVLETGAYI